MKTARVRICESDVKYLSDILKDEETRCKLQVNIEDGDFTEKSQKYWAKKLEQARKMKDKVMAWMAMLR